jgi:hypothetical protein
MIAMQCYSLGYLHSVSIRLLIWSFHQEDDHVESPVICEKEKTWGVK